MKKNGIVAVPATHKTEQYQYLETRELVQLVKEAADLIHTKGEAAFDDFRSAGSRWRQDESYIFALDLDGNMLLHHDPELEGKNQLELKDINGKPIIRGLLNAATAQPEKPEGWYHYQWPVPDGLLPRWKSSYVQLVKAPSGKSYVVGSGVYNDRMEREFVADLVNKAVAEIEHRGEAAFELLRDPKSPYIAKDAYVFVMDMEGVELFNPAFPTLVGRNLINMKDASGKLLNQEIIKVAQEQGAGWLDYMWPKPGESVPTQKTAYIRKARLGDKNVIVGCGAYMADAPKEAKYTSSMTAPELVELVREAAALLEKEGEKAFPEFKKQGTKWLHDDIYFFIWTMDGVRALHPEIHPEKPEVEGKDARDAKDAIGKPYGKLFLEAASTPEGEGWIHCMWPKPFDIFPTWKSCFVKRVTFPSGKEYLVGSGIYNMQVDKTIIEDVVDRAAALVQERGKAAFDLLRDKKGPFYFMDTYVFVESPEGVELVNPAQPSLEGRNLLNLKDLKGKTIVRDEIAAAITEGSAWLECYWYQPGTNAPALKETFVRMVQHNGETYIVGSGIYRAESHDGSPKRREIIKTSWKNIKEEKLTDKLSRQVIFGEKGTLARLFTRKGARIARHYHENEEYSMIVSGALKFNFDDREETVRAGEFIIIPSNVPHSIDALEDSEFVDFFAPAREDWLRGEDQYLRK
ncbi:cache domain-containing protein [Pontibacter sp. KCTC 32443]|uniref:cache domain-containing protein n=1 Tax=Pontibacter TaxID=323449 RepID=UPI00164D3B17|nr:MULTISPECIES: cache domain-containing protein [Pontibacter]MBC5773048.1 cache domain-containing protein [Pontibacter sp. KCTC 32443]